MFGVAQTFVQNLKDLMAARNMPCALNQSVVTYRETVLKESKFDVVEYNGKSNLISFQ